MRVRKGAARKSDGSHKGATLHQGKGDKVEKEKILLREGQVAAIYRMDEEIKGQREEEEEKQVRRQDLI